MEVTMAQADCTTNAIRVPITGASEKPSTNPIRAACADVIARLAGHPPRPIPLDPHAVDLEDRLDHLEKVFTALSAYVIAILSGTAENVPGGLDLRHVDGLLSDLASDMIGTLQHAVERMAWRVA
jgi:hypothetical protein